MNTKQLEPIRDQIFDLTWVNFINSLQTKKSKRVWALRKNEFETFFKGAWMSGAITVLDLLKEASEKRLVQVVRH